MAEFHPNRPIPRDRDTRPRGRPDREDYSPPSAAQIRSFITDDAQAAAMVQEAETLGRHLKDTSVTTNQIRNAYGNMKKLEMAGWGSRTQREVILLKPRLAYAVGRQKEPAKTGLHNLQTVLNHAIDAPVNDADTFKRFCQFFEAIVAYHKAAGGS